MYISDIQLNLVRKNPIAYYSCGDTWLLNFAILNYNLQKYKVELNPELGTDESVADYITRNNLTMTVWFFDHLNDRDYFIPIP